MKKITHRGRLFFDKFERIDAPLNLNIMREHAAKKIVVAHDLITKDNKVENVDVSISHCKDYAVANVTVLFK